MVDTVLVIGAAFANFIVCGFFYALVGKKWMAAWKLKESDISSKDPTPYLVSFIGSLWTSYGFFILLKHLQPKNMIELMTVAIGTWLLILVGTSMKHYSFARVSLNAFLIDHLIDGIGYITICYIIYA